VIIDGLLMLLTGIVQWAYDLLPEWNIQDQLFGGMLNDGRGWTPMSGYWETSGQPQTPLTSIFASMWQMNKYVPVDHLLAAMTLVGVFWGAVLAFRVGKWLIGVIRGSGTQ